MLRRGVGSGILRRAMPGAASRPTGVRLIILYKMVKAAAEVLLAVALIVLAASREMEALQRTIAILHAHVVGRWSIAFAALLAKVATRRGLHLVSAGVAADAVLTGFEGWSLWRGYSWGPWLVVLATGTPIPLEILEILRRPRAGRILVTAINVAIVVYLARRIVARRRERGAMHVAR